ncbi:MAG: hypothetical protein HZC13_01255 [Nitrospirae bacterium]|nr:hypothetical protein [Nitrospirota bacterium]
MGLRRLSLIVLFLILICHVAIESYADESSCTDPGRSLDHAVEIYKAGRSYSSWPACSRAGVSMRRPQGFIRPSTAPIRTARFKRGHSSRLRMLTSRPAIYTRHGKPMRPISLCIQGIKPHLLPSLA